MKPFICDFLKDYKIEKTFSEFDSLDSETKELAIMYLKKSSERKYGVAKLQLQRLKIE